MSQALANNGFSRLIDQLARERGWSRYYLSKAAGLDPTYLRKFAERKEGAQPDSESIAKLATALGIDPAELFRLAFSDQPAAPALRARNYSLSTPKAPTDQLPPFSETIAIRGIANGSALTPIRATDTIIGYVARPPGLATVSDAYAVYVGNESMVPMHNPGELRFVHPHKPPHSGDSVVVQVRDGAGDIEVYIKIYDKTANGWVICRQLNPAIEIRYKKNRLRQFITS